MEPQRFRFIVSSAEEAVVILRDRLGDQARVVSVRQVEGTGLARFLHAPKLEVIAELAASEETEFAPEETRLPEREVNAVPPSVVSGPLSPTAPAEADTSDREAGFARLLRAGGIPAPLLARLQSQSGWEVLEKMAPGRALTHVGRLLREEFQAIPRRPLGDRVAFIGSPGAGKTTALCKWLASEVFVRRRRGAVLKLDLDRANPGDALAVFCEALGVPCARSVPDVPTLGPDQALYIDLPGIVPGCAGDLAPLHDALGPLFTTSRVMVINAAYDSGLIKRAFEFASGAGGTHVVFTHLDELTHCGKLWEFLLDHQLTPLFLGTGPNIAGDLEEHVFDAVLARTFPEAGLQAAKSQMAQ